MPVIRFAERCVGARRRIGRLGSLGLRVRVASALAEPTTTARRILGSRLAPGLAIAAGLALSLAFEPIAQRWVAPVALVAFIATAREASSARQAFICGHAFGLGFMGSHVVWLAEAISPAAWAALSLVEALWFGVVATLVRATRDLPGKSLLAAGAWTGVEVIRRGWPFGGFPWGMLGTTALDTPVQPLLGVAGVSGAGFVLAWMSAALFEVTVCQSWASRSADDRTPHHKAETRPPPPSSVGRGRTRGCADMGGALIVGLMLTIVGRIWSTTQANEPPQRVRVAAVQGGVPDGRRDIAPVRSEITEAQVRRTIDIAAGPSADLDLVVWPESGLSADPRVDQSAGVQVSRASTSVGAPLLVATLTDGLTASTGYNQAQLWEMGNFAGQTYTKRHLVPFGEFIPFRSVLGGLSGDLAAVSTDLLPGPPAQPMRIGDRLVVANAVCFDVAYPVDLMRQTRDGANVVIVQTSNATFGGTTQPAQQLEITRTRAAELGRSVVVASLNGVTALIDPTGRVLAEVSTNDGAVMIVEAPLRDGISPAAIAAPILEWTTIGSTGAITLVASRRQRAVRDC